MYFAPGDRDGETETPVLRDSERGSWGLSQRVGRFRDGRGDLPRSCALAAQAPFGPQDIMTSLPPPLQLRTAPRPLFHGRGQQCSRPAHQSAPLNLQRPFAPGALFLALLGDV